jgi:hypothetical protein
VSRRLDPDRGILRHDESTTDRGGLGAIEVHGPDDRKYVAIYEDGGEDGRYVAMTPEDLAVIRR